MYDEIQITWNTLNAGLGHNFKFFLVRGQVFGRILFQGLQVQETENSIHFWSKTKIFANN